MQLDSPTWFLHVATLYFIFFIFILKKSEFWGITQNWVMTMMKVWGAADWMEAPSSMFSCFRLCVRLVCLPWLCFSSFVPSHPLYFLVFSFIPLCCLFLFFSSFRQCSRFSPHVRPFSGFYKAREGRVLMPSEMRHVPWGIVGIVVLDLLAVFPVDPVFGTRRWWTMCVENDTDFTRNDYFQFDPWTSDI